MTGYGNRHHLWERPDWFSAAECGKPENANLDFFPDTLTMQRQALAVCNVCPVLEECASWALDTRQAFGVWGGMTQGKRARIFKERAQARRAMPLTVVAE